VLIWGYNNNDKRFILRSRRYFLGRPDHQDIKKLGGGVSGLDVLIFNPDNYSEKEYTGWRSLTVSRRHALLYKRFAGKRCELVIKDHGPNGTGSKNGTFINDRMMPTGGEAVLREGDTVRLSSLGPLFMIGVQKKDRTEVSLSAGVPVEVPAQIAEGLIAKDAVVDHFRVGNRFFVVISDAETVELGKDLVVSIGKETTYRKIVSVISIIRGELYRVKDSVKDGREEDAKTALQVLERMLENEFCRRLFRDIGAEKVINGLYNDIIKLVNHGIPIENIAKNIEVYIRLLDNLERYVL